MKTAELRAREKKLTSASLVSFAPHVARQMQRDSGSESDKKRKRLNRNAGGKSVHVAFNLNDGDKSQEKAPAVNDVKEVDEKELMRKATRKDKNLRISIRIFW